MLKTKVSSLDFKPAHYKPTDCEIEKVIKLSGEQYDHFASHLHLQQDFIKENVDLMKCDKNDTQHCLLVTGEGRQDGILVQSEGYFYPRYTAFMPNAADYLQAQAMSPALVSLNKYLSEIVDFVMQEAEGSHGINKYKSSLESINDQYSINFNYDETLLETVCDMISEKKNINNVSYDNDFIYYEIEQKAVMDNSSDIPKQNYDKLCELAPEFMNGNKAYAAFISPNDPTRLIELSVGNESDSNIIMTQTVQSGGHHPITDIDMELKINKDDGTARTVSFQREGLAEPQTVLTESGYNHKMEAECNLFLSDWLDDIKQNGFEQKEFEQNNSMDMDGFY